VNNGKAKEIIHNKKKNNNTEVYWNQPSHLGIAPLLA